MKRLLLAVILLTLPLTAKADNSFDSLFDTGGAEQALRFIQEAMSALQGTQPQFELAYSDTSQAKQLLTAQMEIEKEKPLRKLLRAANMKLSLALKNILAKDVSWALDNLGGAATLTEDYLDAKTGEELGLCCTRENCKGCTIMQTTIDTCKEAGIYKTFRKHDESNPYPNPPKEGQCVNI